MKKADVNKQLEIIRRGAVEIISEDELRKKLERSLARNTPLKVKAGFDPTAPDIHLGHTVLLRKLRQFQELGHEVYFLIGDFTARIGDPTGRSLQRKVLNSKQVSQNAATYRRQANKILDLKRLKVVFNGQWFDRMKLSDFLGITMNVTVQQIIQREDFKKRVASGQEISMLEFVYPLLQGYDSVRLQADIELGGTDQIFNLLVGRDMQKDFGQEEQVVITMPLLEGTDGGQKMSKSYANYIGINEPPAEIFGKIMSIPDELMFKYYELLTDEDLDSVRKMHPKDAKIRLAKIIIVQYHSEKDADKAALEFERVFAQKGSPSSMLRYRLTGEKKLIDIIIESGLVSSKNEVRRLIAGGGIYLDGERIDKEDTVINKAGVLKVGKRRFLKLEK